MGRPPQGRWFPCVLGAAVGSAPFWLEAGGPLVRVGFFGFACGLVAAGCVGLLRLYRDGAAASDLEV